MKNKIILISLLIIQTIIYIVVGLNKEYLHIDEVYSFGLANYDKIDIQDNENFFNNWHSKEYYKDYLIVDEDEKGKYLQVYENQKNDVHPPLYYLILRIVMGMNIGKFSKWTGISINIIIYIFITIFMYLILKNILKDEKNCQKKSIILAFVSSITLASVSIAIYIRMYSLLTLEILITTYLHIKLIQSNEKVNFKLLIKIGVTILASILTHYYYLFYISALYLIIFIKYIKEKNYKLLIYYTLTVLFSGIISLIIFPYSITHMFFGYRGKGVISKLQNIEDIIKAIFSQIYNLNYYAFNNFLFIILGLIIVLLILNKMKKINIINQQNKEILKLIYIPTIFFFVMATFGSPWNVLRYIVSICSLAFILIIYYLYRLLKNILNEKVCNIVMTIILSVIIIMPIIFKLKPELLYKGKKEVIQEISNNANLPTIYLFNKKVGNSFLEDILLFSIIDESYIMEYEENSEKNIKEILKNKDISKGVIIIINGQQDNINEINKIKEELNFTNSTNLVELTSGNAYYIF